MPDSARRIALMVIPAILCAAGIVGWLGAHPAYAADQVVSDCGDNGGPAQLRARLTAAQNSGGGAITFSCGPLITLTAVLPAITSTITVDGADAMTLSSTGLHQLFVVNSGGILALDNITLTNAFWLADGGAIAVNAGGALSIDHSALLNNHASNSGSGGAIVSYGPLTISNSILAYNFAANGGAVYPRFSAATTLIVNSVLHDNYTTGPSYGWGGALLTWGAAPITIVDSSLYSNTARSGGALFGIQTSQITLTRSAVYSNVASYGTGGGVDTLGSLNVIDSQVLSNTAYYTDTTLSYADGGGGGINIRQGAQAVISGSRIDANVVTTTNAAYAIASGGGIFSAGSLSLTSSSLSGNYAQAIGGAAAVTSSAALSLVSMTNNFATDAGAGIYVSGGTLQASDVILESNQTDIANLSESGLGGALFNSTGARTSFSGSRFLGNSSGTGGAVANYGVLTLSQSLLMSNTSAALGGAIFNHDPAPWLLLDRTLYLDQVTIRANSAITDGGGIWNASALTLVGSTLNDNAAGQSGGAIASRGALVATNSTISGNRANAHGGGIFNTFYNGASLQIGTVDLYNVTIAFNTADADGDSLGLGGGVYNVVSGTVNTRNSLLAGNTQFGVANDCHGVLHSYGGTLLSTTDGCTVAGDLGSWSLTDPRLLGPLRENGGPTWTHALLPGSNAIDGGDPVNGCTDFYEAALSTDQRGVSRPQGAACDVGAYEFEGAVQRLYLPLIRR